MSRISTASSGLVPFGVLLFGLCLIGSTLAASNVRQQPSQASPAVTSLVASGTAAMQSLPKIVLPAVRSLVAAPLRLLRQLLAEMMDFLRQHRFAEIYDLRFWQQIVSRLPDRATTYWHTLVSMESQCAQRTICDLADLTSSRTPKWFQQIALIYLNTFSEVYPYYTIAIQGLTAHNCATSYAECDAEQFLERVRGNVTESIASTVAPMRDAFNELVAVTSSTIQSLADPKPQEPEPMNRQRVNAGAAPALVDVADDSQGQRPPPSQVVPVEMRNEDFNRALPRPIQGGHNNFNNFNNPQPFPMRQPVMNRNNGFPRHH